MTPRTTRERRKNGDEWTDDLVGGEIEEFHGCRSWAGEAWIDVRSLLCTRGERRLAVLFLHGVVIAEVSAVR